ncbi:hypothetical protein [Actinomadura harenae]|uniref:Uncharacterized protein n=1 Tax=Actinomadura harenae TaxID=2483351 RepID=A0A3M2M7Y1_9ACTN|nr:hypothetical protein [Actinomadura harenae]RMI45747.1 hypothetical protein EBO15_09160 [Actinomadura harenae]
MRRIATVAITSGALVAGLMATGGNAFADGAAKATVSSTTQVARPGAPVAGDGMTAQGKTAFTLKKSGLSATTAYGYYWFSSYHGKPVRVLDGRVRDNAYGLDSCMQVVFWPGRYQNQKLRDGQIIYNTHGKGTTARLVISSYLTGKMYMRECEGYPVRGGFHISHGGKWRIFY